jgi:hypothetical protein
MLHLSMNTLALQSSFLFLLFFVLRVLCVGARPDLVGAPSALILSVLSCRVPR